MGMNTDVYRELVNNLFDGVYFVDKDRKIIFWNYGESLADRFMYKCKDGGGNRVTIG